MNNSPNKITLFNQCMYAQNRMFVTCKLSTTNPTTFLGSITITVSSRSSILTRAVSKSDKGTILLVYRICNSILSMFVQIPELRKYYANVPGACDLAEKCLQVGYVYFLLKCMYLSKIYKCTQGSGVFVALHRPCSGYLDYRDAF